MCKITREDLLLRLKRTKESKELSKPRAPPDINDLEYRIRVLEEKVRRLSVLTTPFR